MIKAVDDNESAEVIGAGGRTAPTTVRTWSSVEWRWQRDKILYAIKLEKKQLKKEFDLNTVSRIAKGPLTF
jgi:hypothetical protein